MAAIAKYQTSFNGNLPAKPLYTTINRYNPLIRQLGAGSFGAVWMAKDSTTGQMVAIKLMDANRHDQGYNHSVLNEIVYPLALDHPNIVKYSAIVGPQKVSAIKFSPGNDKPDYEEFIGVVMSEAQGDLWRLTESRLAAVQYNYAKLAYQLVSPIVYLASHNIIHRDLKPGNILYNGCPTDPNDYKLTIIDFGLAIDGECYERYRTSHAYTLWYRPPEIALASNPDSVKYNGEADVWALACILYEMWTGRVLFLVDTTKNGVENLLVDVFSKVGRPEPDKSDFYQLYEKWAQTHPQLQTKIKDRSNPLAIITDTQLRLLLSGMLRLNPVQRMSIFEVGSHPFFQRVAAGSTVDSCYKLAEMLKINCLRRDNFFRRNLSFNRLSEEAFHPVANPDVINTLTTWMRELTFHFERRLEVYALASQLLFRTLITGNISKSKLQLTGTVAMAIADNAMSVVPASLESYASMTKGGVSIEEIVEGERVMLQNLNFDLLATTPYDNILAYSQEVSQLAIQLGGEILLHLTSIPYYFEWKLGTLKGMSSASYVYRSNLPLNCLTLVSIGLKEDNAVTSRTIDILAINHLIGVINRDITIRHRKWLGLGLKIKEWNKLVEQYNLYRKNNPRTLRVLLLTQNNQIDPQILKLFSSAEVKYYNVSNDSSITGGQIDDATIKQLGENSYDIVVVEACTNNCLDTIRSGMKLLVTGGQLYTTNIVNLALEKKIDDNLIIYFPLFTPSYRTRLAQLESAKNQVENDLKQARNMHLDMQLTAQQFSVRQAQIHQQLASIDKQIIKMNGELAERKKDRLKTLIANYKWREGEIVNIVVKYVSDHSQDLGYSGYYT